jgi:hypothetical protein
MNFSEDWRNEISIAPLLGGPCRISHALILSVPNVLILLALNVESSRFGRFSCPPYDVVLESMCVAPSHGKTIAALVVSDFPTMNRA